MFLGEYEHSIDAKGRIAIPARFRDALKAGAVVTKGFDRCLIVYSLEQWMKRAEAIAALPENQLNSRRFTRSTFASAYTLDLDRQGRILLPPSLRQYADLNGNAVVAGLHTYLEIWDSQLWGAEKKLMDEQIPEIAESIELPSAQ